MPSMDSMELELELELELVVGKRGWRSEASPNRLPWEPLDTATATCLGEGCSCALLICENFWWAIPDAQRIKGWDSKYPPKRLQPEKRLPERKAHGTEVANESGTTKCWQEPNATNE